MFSNFDLHNICSKLWGMYCTFTTRWRHCCFRGCPHIFGAIQVFLLWKTEETKQVFLMWRFFHSICWTKQLLMCFTESPSKLLDWTLHLSNKIREVQFKILHNIYLCKRLISRFAKVDEMCTFVGQRQFCICFVFAHCHLYFGGTLKSLSTIKLNRT